MLKPSHWKWMRFQFPDGSTLQVSATIHKPRSLHGYALLHYAVLVAVAPMKTVENSWARTPKTTLLHCHGPLSPGLLQRARTQQPFYSLRHLWLVEYSRSMRGDPQSRAPSWLIASFKASTDLLRIDAFVSERKPLVWFWHSQLQVIRLLHNLQ